MNDVKRSISYYQNNNRIQIVRISHGNLLYEFSFHGKLKYENPNFSFLLDSEKGKNGFFSGILYFNRYKTLNTSLNNHEAIPIRIIITSENPSYSVKRETSMSFGSHYKLPKFKVNDLIQIEILPFLPFTISNEYAFLQSFVMSFLPITPRFVTSSPYHPLCSWVREKSAGLNPDFLQFISWFKLPTDFITEKQYHYQWSFINYFCKQFSNETGFKVQPVLNGIQSKDENDQSIDIIALYNLSSSDNSIIPHHISLNKKLYCLISSVMKNNENYGILFFSQGVEKFSAFYSLFNGNLHYHCDLNDPPIILKTKDIFDNPYDQFRLFGVTAIYASLEIVQKLHQIPATSPYIPTRDYELLPKVFGNYKFLCNSDKFPNIALLSDSYSLEEFIMVETLKRDNENVERFIPMLLDKQIPQLESIYNQLYSKLINFENNEIFSAEQLRSLGVSTEQELKKEDAFQKHFWYPSLERKPTDLSLKSWLRYIYHPVILFKNCILFDYYSFDDDYIINIPAQNLVFLRAIDIDPEQSKNFPHSFIELRFYRKISSKNIIEYTHPPVLIKRFDSKTPRIIMCNIEEKGDYIELFHSIYG